MDNRYRKSGRIIFLGTLVAWLTTALVGAQAQTTNSWTETGDGFWDEYYFWSLGVAPTNSQSLVQIANAASKTVTIDSTTASSHPDSLTISNLLIRGVGADINSLQLINAGAVTPLDILNGVTIGTNATLVVTNSTLRVEGLSGGPFVLDGSVTNAASGQIISSNSNFTVGSIAQSRGNLTTRGGLLVVSNSVVVGAVAGAVGNLTLAGGTNQLSANLAVGNLGNSTGTVWVTDGHLAVTNSIILGNLAGSSGQMTVSNGTVLAKNVLLGPNGGSGTLTISGGVVTNFGVTTIAGFSGAQGSVWMNGGQWVIPNGTTTVARAGFGQMTLSNGTLRCVDLIVGDQPVTGGTGGTLTIAGGTNMVSGRLLVGRSLGATGSVFIASGQMTVFDLMAVGQFGYGKTTIAGSGRLLPGAFGLIIGDRVGAQGELLFNGSTAVLSAPGNPITVGNLGAGQLTVSNGFLLVGSMTVGKSVGGVGTLTIAGGNSHITSNMTVGVCGLAIGIASVTGGELYITNDFGNAVLDVRGVITQSGGLLAVDQLIITNECGRLYHTGGSLLANNQILTPSFDADGDGLINSYEEANGLDPLNPNDALLDNDGDGQNNLDEYLVGTDPNDANSFLRIISIVVTNDDVLITWPITPYSGTGNVGMGYNLLWGTNPSNGITNLLANFFVPVGSPATTNYLDVGGATNVPGRLYRLQGFPD